MFEESEKTFESSLKRLEEIVQQLEGDQPSLEDALKLFEEGRTLIAFCTDKLDTAEQKLKVLSES
jgi:exodeoxyribonuclease VII small subunit